MQQKRFACRPYSKSTHSATAASHFVTRNNAMKGDDQLANNCDSSNRVLEYSVQG
jgi:hypothetical protein